MLDVLLITTVTSRLFLHQSTTKTTTKKRNILKDSFAKIPYICRFRIN